MLNIVSLLLLLQSIIGVEAQWTCQAFVYQQNYYLRSYFNNQQMYDYLIGPGYSGCSIDRVLQTAWWDNSITGSVTSGDPRDNVNQAGSCSPSQTNTPAYSVVMNTSLCSIEVYSTPQLQWNSQLTSQIKAKYGLYSKVQLVGDGNLLIRKVFYVTQTYKGANPTPQASPYIEAWSPFLVPLFSCLALHVDANGTPDWYYRTNYNIPYYPGFPVGKTNGYGLVYTCNSPNNLALALVYGTNSSMWCINDKCSSYEAGYELNSMDFNAGICILPGMSPGMLEPNDVIDQTYYVLTRPTLSSDLS